jgi:hypothetical protein
MTNNQIVRSITHDMLIAETDGFRLKVQTGTSAQTSGSEFETTQTSTAATAPQVLRITAPEPVDITEMEMTVVLGGVSVQVFEASAGTAGGSFTAAPVQSTNLRNPKAPTFSAASGGTFTPSAPALRQMVVNGGTALAPLASVSQVNRKPLSLPAGTYYIVTGLLSGVASVTGQLVVTIVDL